MQGYMVAGADKVFSLLMWFAVAQRNRPDR